MVRMQWVVCPECGHGHTFFVPAGGAVAQRYGFVCPETGHPAAIDLEGHWMSSEFPGKGAVVLLALAVDAELPAA